MPKHNWVTLYTYFDIFEGQQLEGLLKENDIPVINQPREDTAYKKIFKASMGEGVLKVPQQYKKQAERFIHEYGHDRPANN